jgi:hypothetical protein
MTNSQKSQSEKLGTNRGRENAARTPRNEEASTGDAPQGAEGQSTADFLTKIQEDYPTASSDDLTMMIIEGAGHADPTAWPTGLEQRAVRTGSQF